MKPWWWTRSMLSPLGEGRGGHAQQMKTIKFWSSFSSPPSGIMFLFRRGYIWEKEISHPKWRDLTSFESLCCSEEGVVTTLRFSVTLESNAYICLPHTPFWEITFDSFAKCKMLNALQLILQSYINYMQNQAIQAMICLPQSNHGQKMVTQTWRHLLMSFFLALLTC